MARPSPITGQPMNTLEFLGVTLDICPTTGGIWFDQGELGRIRAATAEHFHTLEEVAEPNVEPIPTLPRSRLCPVDATQLETFRYLACTNIELDSCPQCGGVFVEEGELARMHAFLAERAEKRGLPVARTAEAVAIMESESIGCVGNAKGVAAMFQVMSIRTHPWTRVY